MLWLSEEETYYPIIEWEKNKLDERQYYCSSCQRCQKGYA